MFGIEKKRRAKTVSAKYCVDGYCNLFYTGIYTGSNLRKHQNLATH